MGDCCQRVCASIAQQSGLAARRKHEDRSQQRHLSIFPWERNSFGRLQNNRGARPTGDLVKWREAHDFPQFSHLRWPRASGGEGRCRMLQVPPTLLPERKIPSMHPCRIARVNHTRAQQLQTDPRWRPALGVPLLQNGHCEKHHPSLCECAMGDEG